MSRSRIWTGAQSPRLVRGTRRARRCIDDLDAFALDARLRAAARRHAARALANGRSCGSSSICVVSMARLRTGARYVRERLDLDSATAQTDRGRSRHSRSPQIAAATEPAQSRGCAALTIARP